jgi:hypothetical protein
LFFGVLLSKLPISRAEAKALGVLRYFTGKPCKHGHLAPSLTSSAECVECHAIRRRLYMRKWAANNPKVRRRKAAKWYNKNRELVLKRTKRWKQNNPIHVTSLRAKYRANYIKACPAWVDDAHMDKIREIYKLCRKTSKETGVMHAVDHIVPLQGKTVCGLHVWWNLRVITQEENNRRPKVWDATMS